MMKMHLSLRTALVTGMMLAAFFLLISSAGAVTLVENGHPAATIVLPSQPTDIEQRAAGELQKYLEMMSGARLPIKSVDATLKAGDLVFIGRQTGTLSYLGHCLNEERLGYDGVALKSSPHALLILGHKGNGQLFAVYELLKRLGCRFYLPHPDGEVVPQRSTIKVENLSYIHKPDFIHRVHWNNGNVNPTLVHPEWYADWAAKNYQGGVRIMHGHNYHGFCPAAQYFETHPEYFPLLPGPEGEMERSASGQLCLSNPDVVNLAAEAAIRTFDADPNLLSYSLSPNDTSGWCECAQCKAMDSPDPEVGLAWRVLKFNNQVAERVAQKHPDKLVFYYGEYGNMPGPPVGMEAHPNVIAGIVNFYDLMHDINDPNSAQNIEYRKRLQQWAEIARQLFVYEWYTYSMLPSPQVYVVGPRIRYYRDLGVIGYSGEVLNRSPDNDLSMYIASQMLWDADQDPEAILDEFFDLYFVEAAEQMREYYDILHETSYYSDYHGVRALDSAWTAERIKRLYAQLERAFAASEQEIVRRRLWREQKCLAAVDRVATAYRCADLWALGDKEARDRGRRAVAAAVAYLDKLADEDIVADTYIRENVRRLQRRLARCRRYGSSSWIRKK